MKYYVNSSGKFMGGWDINPPEELIEVALPPSDARQIWDGSGWITPALPYSEALADLNAAYQADVDSLNRAFTVATLAEGASMVAKQNAIKAQFSTRKTEYMTAYAALRAQYGV